jgi:hypothetical protein
MLGDRCHIIRRTDMLPPSFNRCPGLNFRCRFSLSPQIVLSLNLSPSFLFRGTQKTRYRKRGNQSCLWIVHVHFGNGKASPDIAEAAQQRLEEGFPRLLDSWDGGKYTIDHSCYTIKAQAAWSGGSATTGVAVGSGGSE